MTLTTVERSSSRRSAPSGTASPLAIEPRRTLRIGPHIDPTGIRVDLGQVFRARPASAPRRAATTVRLGRGLGKRASDQGRCPRSTSTRVRPRCDARDRR